MRKLTQAERAVLRHPDQDDDTIAAVERLPVGIVAQVRLKLRSRGAALGARQPTCTEDQLSLDRLMRTNRAPKPTNIEIGDTTSTDPEGW